MRPSSTALDESAVHGLQKYRRRWSPPGSSPTCSAEPVPVARPLVSNTGAGVPVPDRPGEPRLAAAVVAVATVAAVVLAGDSARAPAFTHHRWQARCPPDGTHFGRKAVASPRCWHR